MEAAPPLLHVREDGSPRSYLSSSTPNGRCNLGSMGSCGRYTPGIITTTTYRQFRASNTQPCPPCLFKRDTPDGTAPLGAVILDVPYTLNHKAISHGARWDCERRALSLPANTNADGLREILLSRGGRVQALRQGAHLPTTAGDSLDSLAHAAVVANLSVLDQVRTAP